MANNILINSGLDSVPIQRVTLRGINGKTGGAIVVGTIPAGNKIFVPTQTFLGVSAPAAITTPPSISLGTNGPNYDDMMAITSFTGAANAKGGVLPLKPVFPLLLPGTTVQLNITTPGASTGAITLTLIILGMWA